MIRINSRTNVTSLTCSGPKTQELRNLAWWRSLISQGIYCQGWQCCTNHEREEFHDEWRLLHRTVGALSSSQRVTWHANLIRCTKGLVCAMTEHNPHTLSCTTYPLEKATSMSDNFLSEWTSRGNAYHMRSLAQISRLDLQVRFPGQISRSDLIQEIYHRCLRMAMIHTLLQTMQTTDFGRAHVP